MAGHSGNHVPHRRNLTRGYSLRRECFGRPLGLFGIGKMIPPALRFELHGMRHKIRGMRRVTSKCLITGLFNESDCPTLASMSEKFAVRLAVLLFPDASGCSRPILLKKSLRGFISPAARKSTSQIGPQTARAHRPRVRRQAKPITILAGSSCCCRANSFEGGESHFDKLLLTSGSVATLFAQNHKKRKWVGRT
ncbi:hypothetical protein QFZ98_003872 [Paraburkholderia youngii]